MVSINRSSQKEGSLVSSKMLATKQVISGLCEFTHAHREETLAELCMWLMIERSPSLLNAQSSIPSTKQNQVKNLLYAAEEHGACTGTVPWAGEEESGKRTKRGGDAPTSRGTGLRACHTMHPPRCSLPVSLCVGWGHKLFTQPSAPL